MLSIGVYPRMKLAEALRLYAEYRDAVDNGIDPGDKHVETSSTTRNSPLVKSLAKDYIEKYAKLNMKTWAEDQRMLELDIVPQLGAMKASSVRKGHIIERIDAIVARNAPVSANRTLGAAERMFGWAVDRGILSVSPCEDVKRPYKEKSRNRYLNLKEIKAFRTLLPNAGLHKETRAALDVLLFTMQRTTEVIGINLSEIDLAAKHWIIPSERTKNGEEHLVPLSAPAIDIIESLIPGATEDGFLFPGRGENKIMCQTTLSHAVRDNLKFFGLPPFTPHDFRRTGSTLLGAFGVSRFERERILNHKDDSCLTSAPMEQISGIA